MTPGIGKCKCGGKKRVFYYGTYRGKKQFTISSKCTRCGVRS